ncbi:hypothetical protein VNO77_11008 [Canavalia gladiata]|uniref:Uncharacterized protein n=1 Tax=Canavalia gladiata TaxID=3824 RepID=A0AAN9R2F2_CANGL
MLYTIITFIIAPLFSIMLLGTWIFVHFSFYSFILPLISLHKSSIRPIFIIGGHVIDMVHVISGAKITTGSGTYLIGYADMGRRKNILFKAHK